MQAKFENVPKYCYFNPWIVTSQLPGIVFIALPPKEVDTALY